MYANDELCDKRSSLLGRGEDEYKDVNQTYLDYQLGEH